MPVRNNTASLVDVMTRYQIYLEGFKLYTGTQFHQTAKALRDDIRAAFADLDVENISDLTRRELERFISKLDDIQQARFDTFNQETLLALHEFLNADLDLNNDIMEETQESSPGILAALGVLLAAKSRKKLWAKVQNTPIPANGLKPAEFLDRYAGAGALSVETVVRIAHANKATTQATVRRVVGSARSPLADGIVPKLELQAQAVVNTLIQHVSSIISANVAQIYYARYQWVSVLDQRTTPICLERNGKIWPYNDGPLPPAHINCRSKTVPVDGDDAPVDMTYYAWLKEQPDAVQNDILGDRAAALRNGTVTAKDLPKFYAQDMLTLAQFVGKLDLMLAT